MILTFAKTKNIIYLVAKIATKEGRYIMPNVTKEIANYIKEQGITVSTIARHTGLSRNVLHNSISGKRKLRADEFLLICKFLKTPPEDFFKPDKAS
jgi:transcriptional regulator with XRE-family HTH domain